MLSMQDALQKTRHFKTEFVIVWLVIDYKGSLLIRTNTPNSMVFSILIQTLVPDGYFSSKY